MFDIIANIFLWFSGPIQPNSRILIEADFLTANPLSVKNVVGDYPAIEITR
jgi:hypothetical protein